MCLLVCFGVLASTFSQVLVTRSSVGETHRYWGLRCDTVWWALMPGEERRGMDRIVAFCFVLAHWWEAPGTRGVRY